MCRSGCTFIPYLVRCDPTHLIRPLSTDYCFVFVCPSLIPDSLHNCTPNLAISNDHCYVPRSPLKHCLVKLNHFTSDHKDTFQALSIVIMILLSSAHNRISIISECLQPACMYGGFLVKPSCCHILHCFFCSVVSQPVCVLV